MAQRAKHVAGSPDQPAAASVDREPKDEPTPQEQGRPIDREDGPKGHPTSDRFHTEQAHTKGEKDAEDG